MFRHIGRKVRVLAVILFWLGILASLGFGTYAYLTDLLPLPACIASGLGGCIAFWIVSWALYCIGDTNDRIERATEEDTPKPGYMDYIQSPATMTSGACEFCGKESNYLTDAKVTDKLGTRYRKVCPECFRKYHCTVA